MADKIEFGWGSLPGELLDKWPAQADGGPVAPAYLTHCKSSDMEDELLVNMLMAYGIPSLRVYPGYGAFGKIILGISGTGTHILVPETMIEDAKALMEADSDDQLQS